MIILKVVLSVVLIIQIFECIQASRNATSYEEEKAWRSSSIGWGVAFAFYVIFALFAPT